MEISIHEYKETERAKRRWLVDLAGYAFAFASASASESASAQESYAGSTLKPSFIKPNTVIYYKSIKLNFEQDLYFILRKIKLKITFLN